MTHSSWGPGWPNCQGGKIIGNFEVDGTRFPGGVREELAELVTLLVRESKKRGYQFGVDGDPSYGCWGYSCRSIGGGSTPSNHSWGLALDINAPQNPQKKPLTTNIPDWMPNLWNAYGFRWGGDYTSSTPDPMHFEYMGSVQDCAYDTDRARNDLADSGGDDDMGAAYIVRNPTYGIWLCDSNNMTRRLISQAYADANTAFGMLLLDVDNSWFGPDAPLEINSWESSQYVSDHDARMLEISKIYVDYARRMPSADEVGTWAWNIAVAAANGSIQPLYDFFNTLMVNEGQARLDELNRAVNKVLAAMPDDNGDLVLPDDVVTTQDMQLILEAAASKAAEISATVKETKQEHNRPRLFGRDRDE